MQQGCYEINVSLDGKHFFATADRSATTEYEAKRIMKVFKEKFPAEEGYKVDVTQVICYGQAVDFNE